MESEIVTDIFDNHFQVALGNEKVSPGGKLMRFNDEYFADQFVRWLRVDEKFWHSVLRTKIPFPVGCLHYDEIAKKLVRGDIRFVKLPNSQNPPA